MQQKRCKTTVKTQGLQAPVLLINLILRRTTYDKNDLDVTRLSNQI